MPNIIKAYNISDKINTCGRINLKKFGYWLFLIIFTLTLPAWASEDGEDYEFDDGSNFSFDSQSDNGEPVALDVVPLAKTDIDNNSNEDKNSQEEIFIPDRPNIDTKPVKNNDNPKDKTKTAPKATLTDKLKKDTSTKGDSIIEGTWIEKLTEISPSKLLGLNNDKADTEESTDEVDEEYEEDGDVSLEGLMHNYRTKSKGGRSNASVFDISGVMLRMSVDQVDYTMQNRGFKKINAKFQIPNFIKWRNEEGCRATGVVGYERTQACVVQKAKKDGYEYVQYLKYAKFDTKETMEIYFTSTFSDNKVYKIEYRSTIANITGNSPKAVYIRNLKVYDFWRRISRKYGVPDDKTRVTWGLGGNKPYMIAKTGFLKLEDPMFVEMDYTRMSREDQKFIHSDFYNF